MTKNEMPAEVRAYIDALIAAKVDPELRDMVRAIMEPALAAFWDALQGMSLASAEHEREECAKVADDGAKGRESTPEEIAANKRAKVIAAAIRARK